MTDRVFALTEQFHEKIHYVGQKHPKIAQVGALINNTKPNPEKLFAIEGIWAHNKLLEAGVEVRSFIFCPEFIYSPEAEALAETFLQVSQEAYCVSSKVFEKLSERDRADGLLSVCKMPLYRPEELTVERDALLVVLDGVEIPGNIGTMLRTLDGAGADGMLICNRRARLTHPKILKGSMGAAFTVPTVEFETVASCAGFLRKKGFSIYLADTRAEKSYYDYAYGGRSALIVGSERYGISPEWYKEEHSMLKIPMLGACDSLNVGVAASIIIYEMSMKTKKLRKDR